jgi:PAS domain S-box-containing protein
MTTTSKKTSISPQTQEVSKHNGHQSNPLIQSLVPHLNWREMSESAHFVQFYETDEYLIDSISEFIGAGLSMGEACIVITSKANQEHLKERWKAEGLDLVTAHTQGQYIVLDAAETLSKFMVDRLPEAERFAEVVGGLIVQAAQGRHKVRIFGDMVAVLWAEGNHAAAIRLEELWNELQHTTPFTLFCAYPMHDFAGEAYGMPLVEICKTHSQVIPDESYTRLSSADERLRAIILLQQKATSLQTEITERKEAQDAWHASEERFRTAFAVAPVGMALTDTKGRFVQVNPAYSRITGYTEQELLQKDFSSIIHPDDYQEHVRLLLELLAGNISGFAIEGRYLKKDGSSVWVQNNVSVLRDSKGEPVNILMITEDITERKKAEERKDSFISMASHELKTPVTSLMGFTQLLKRRLKQLADPQTLLFLDRMDAQIKKLTHLITDLLDISKMQTGILPFRETTIDFDELVRETVENVQATTTTHHIDVQGEVHAQIYGDRDRLEQVLMNLLTNAIKYSPQADTVIVCLSRDEAQIEVAVQDFGIGIAEKYHESIFERFYQVTDSRQHTYPGLGIGLFIARALVERHGGRLWLESQEGEGSTFRFTLPLRSKVEDTSLRTDDELSLFKSDLGNTPSESR